MTIRILRLTVRCLKTVVLYLAAYEYHCLANRSADQLKMRSSPELKDIGYNRSELSYEAHKACPWCHKELWCEL